ncbi:DNA ligase [Vibrio aerogenes CECT 7868]|uniref:DNA ligase n=1 Tax=Vibrio aerogenes CECT 7868 TaxID=1216006 RepID=A0A1M5Z756_9VIBR|nr:DNA ligase [Vibrio aerogenes]SHI20060.1 DNA ligase [Vibrio aerogenes CECT 7868]
MKMKLLYLSVLTLTHPVYAMPFQDSETVMLAESYQKDTSFPFAAYRMSEKLDGIRGIWDGQVLKSRTGQKIYAPDWFYRLLPPFPVEGELWAGRGNFHLVQQTVLDHEPAEKSWKNISFVLFDIPFGTGGYQSRYETIRNWISGQKQNPHLRLIEQYPVLSQKHLDHFMAQIIRKSGEGVMLKNWQSIYHSGRSHDLLKLKPYIDDEAQVVGYKKGQGKYRHQIGALYVQNRQGIRFYIGSGLSDRQRAVPPAIGSWITYRYDRLTDKGKPRFPRLLRERIH